jgi:hypothetical protein
MRKKINEANIPSLKGETVKQMAINGVFSKGGEGALEALNMVRDMKENDEIEEKWSEKYKKSIDCNNPKGFSQRAHCQGKKKKEAKEATGSGSAGGYAMPLFGKIETKEQDDVTKIEATEATGSGSAGSYETTAAWAKSTKKKDWRGKSKTQIPGGKFVQVKKKCKKFPYCNQGDINALKIFENETLKKVISTVSKKHNISEEVIKNIIAYELQNKIQDK